MGVSDSSTNDQVTAEDLTLFNKLGVYGGPSEEPIEEASAPTIAFDVYGKVWRQETTSLEVRDQDGNVIGQKPMLFWFVEWHRIGEEQILRISKLLIDPEVAATRNQAEILGAYKDEVKSLIERGIPIPDLIKHPLGGI